MIKLIGTTHFMNKEEIYKILDENKPEIIAVELCERRLGLKPLGLDENSLIMKIGKSTKDKAEKENIQHGSDMTNAILYANENKIQVGLIDRDIVETAKLMEKIPEKELTLFLKEITNLENKNIQAEADNFKAEEEIGKLKNNYPVAYEFLVSSRDLTLANNLLRLEKNNPNKKIVALIGKGHLQKVEELIK